jgi:MFS family permease
MMTYTAHSQFLPNWFVRRRGLAISIAFSGVGVGAILLLPWLQGIIQSDGWRASCVAMGLLVLFGIAPLALLVRKSPGDVGEAPDGDATSSGSAAKESAATVVDKAWAATEWTLARAMRTARFWWIVLGYFLSCIAWYAVQVHQTKYLVEIGFEPLIAAWALGIVSIVAIPGQILLGALSDRIGREWVWTVGCLGFALSYAALLMLEHSNLLLYAMVFAQGFLGYAMTPVMGPIVAEIFEGPHYGSIFGSITIALIGGGAAGPWLTGAIYDATGSYRAAFFIIIAGCLLSALSIWIAGPRRVRVVAGRAPRRQPPRVVDLRAR